MTRAPETIQQGVKQVYPEMGGSARVYLSFGCPATPDPSPSVSLRDSREAGEGSGLLDNMKCDAGVKKI